MLVAIRDANLKQRLASAIGKSVEEDLYNTDLLGINNPYLSHAQIEDLTGLEYCLNLTQLNLSDNRINNFSALSQLSKLATLDVGNQRDQNGQSNLDLQQLVDQLDELENLTSLKAHVAPKDDFSENAAK